MFSGEGVTEGDVAWDSVESTEDKELAENPYRPSAKSSPSKTQLITLNGVAKKRVVTLMCDFLGLQQQREDQYLLEFQSPSFS